MRSAFPVADPDQRTGGELAGLTVSATVIVTGLAVSATAVVTCLAVSATVVVTGPAVSATVHQAWLAASTGGPLALVDQVVGVMRVAPHADDDRLPRYEGKRPSR